MKTKILPNTLLSLGVILALAAALPVELTFGNSKAPPSRYKAHRSGTLGAASTTNSGSWTIVPSPNASGEVNILV